MNFFYLIKEGLAGFSRARLATAASILTTMVSLILLGIFALLSINLRGLVTNLREKVELEVFINRALSEDEILLLQQKAERIEGIYSVTYISKEIAAQKFNREFGENLFDVIGHNPLPPSFRIRMKSEFRNSKAAQSISDQLARLPGVDEVLYHKDLLQILDQYIKIGLWIGSSLGILFTLAAILLVANTVRLTIYAKRDVIRTMQLVGATNGFIRIPFLVEGLVQGIIAGLVAAGILFVSIQFTLYYITDLIRIPSGFLYSVIGGGIILGVLGSLLSIGKFLDQKNN